MKVKISRMFFLLPFLLTYGCAIRENLSRDATFKNGGKDSILILGIQPYSRILINEGWDKGDVWKVNTEWNVANVYPQEGYVVLKLKGRTESRIYGITEIDSEGRENLYNYNVCNQFLTGTFELPPGKVVYVGDIHVIKKDDGSIDLDIQYHYDAVKEFMEHRYPGIPGDIYQGEIKLKKSIDVLCNPNETMYIPIVIVV